MDYIQQLSDDLLCTIFSFLITSIATLPPIFGDLRLRLMAVSPRWRHIILGSSHLWDTVIVLPSSPEVTPGLAKIAEKWLRFNWENGHTLSVFHLQPQHLADIHRPAPRDREPIGAFRILEDGFLPVAGCTTSFSCTLSTEHGINSFFTIPPAQFCFLERLEIAVPILPHQGLARAIKKTIKKELRHFTALQRLPRLRSAVISIKNGIRPLAFKIPWHQLTRLNMKNTTVRPRIFLDVLSSSAPSLQEGSFTIQFKRISRSTSQAAKNNFRIVKPRFLQILHLRLINPTLNTHIFSRIHATALCQLRIELDHDEAGWMLSIYQNLLSTSHQTLKTLVFWDAPVEGDQSDGLTLVYNPPRSLQDLDSLFSLLPNLEHLRLPIGVHIRRSTADSIAQGILLPSLRNLEVSSADGVDILRMAKNRNELAFRHPVFVGSSKRGSGSHRTGMYPPFFSAVLIFTSSANRSKVELEKRYLQSSPSSQRTAFYIRYANLSL